MGVNEYTDEIVERALEHKLVLDDAGQPEVGNGLVIAGVIFGRCAQGCSVGVGAVGAPGAEPLFNAAEAERRHQLYVAITEALN